MYVESELILLFVIIIHHGPCSADLYQDLTSNHAFHHLKGASSQNGDGNNPASGIISSSKSDISSLDKRYLRKGNSQHQSEFGDSQPQKLPTYIPSVLQSPQHIIYVNSLDPQMDHKENGGFGAKERVKGTGNTFGLLSRLRGSGIKSPQIFQHRKEMMTNLALYGGTNKEIGTGKSNTFISHDDGRFLPYLTIADGLLDTVPDNLGTDVINNPLTNPGDNLICKHKFGHYGAREKQYWSSSNRHKSWGTFFKPVMYPYKSGIDLTNGPTSDFYKLGNIPYEPKINAYDSSYIPHNSATKPYWPDKNHFRPINNPYAHSEKPLKYLHIEIEPPTIL